MSTSCLLYKKFVHDLKLTWGILFFIIFRKEGVKCNYLMIKQLFKAKGLVQGCPSNNFNLSWHNAVCLPARKVQLQFTRVHKGVENHVDYWVQIKWFEIICDMVFSRITFESDKNQWFYSYSLYRPKHGIPHAMVVTGSRKALSWYMHCRCWKCISGWFKVTWVISCCPTFSCQ